MAKVKQDDVLHRIREKYQTLSKGQKRLADYIQNHYEKAVYLTAARMGELVGVSESTVVRFAGELGYDGYPGMQRAMEETIRTRLTALQRMEVSSANIDDEHLVQSVLQGDILNIRETMTLVDDGAFQQAVETIMNAKRIYVLGVRSSAPLASYLGYYLNLFFGNVHLGLTNSISETFEQILKIGPEDCMIGISFPRYSKRTVKAMEYAKARGAAVVAVTDNDQSPIAANADTVLKAYSSMESFVDSLVGPMSLMNALIIAVTRQRQEEVQENLTALESIWKEYDVYEKTDEDTFGKLLS
ncbi:MAG: MurR/RpiR family transcriptional regulator [Lachnospiraceae bacterium]|nr:MurR/RpiR family transcriptional regulator [Lachnospiraceae bacterium]